MKKYLLGLFAIVLAAGLSAFNSTTRTVKHNATLQDYFWYPVTAGLISGPAFNHEALNKTEAIATNPEGCDNSATQVCLVGESSPSLSTGTTPSAATQDEDNRIKRSE